MSKNWKEIQWTNSAEGGLDPSSCTDNNCHSPLNFHEVAIGHAPNAIT